METKVINSDKHTSTLNMKETNSHDDEEQEYFSLTIPLAPVLLPLDRVAKVLVGPRCRPLVALVPWVSLVLLVVLVVLLLLLQLPQEKLVERLRPV